MPFIHLGRVLALNQESFFFCLMSVKTRGRLSFPHFISGGGTINMKFPAFSNSQALIRVASLLAVQTNFSPAQEGFCARTSSGIPLNGPETIQLTENSLGSLPEHISAKVAYYLAFGDGNAAKSRVKCKAASGDTDLPTDDAFPSIQ